MQNVSIDYEDSNININKEKYINTISEEDRNLNNKINEKKI
jgi:hypothetical protein